MEDKERLFEIKLKECADELTYEDFVQLAMVQIQSGETTILNVWEKDKARFVESYDAQFPGDTFLSVVSVDDSWDEERAENEYPGYTQYLSWNYEYEKTAMLNLLYWNLDLFHTPPRLWDKKKMVDREVRPLDYAMKDELIAKGEKHRADYMWAEHIISDFGLCKSNSDLEWFYFRNKYIFCDPLIIMGMDRYRGQEKEQRLVAEIAKINCFSNRRIIFQLWDIDAGFEILRDALSEYEKKGQVLYERSRYNENFSGERGND